MRSSVIPRPTELLARMIGGPFAPAAGNAMMRPRATAERTPAVAPPPPPRMPHVSVIIPTHNRAGELAQTLRSVAAQTLGDWEALVIDDASEEDIRAVVDAAGDARIRYRCLPDALRGAPAARNFGAANTTGDYVLFLDSDDLLSPTALERRSASLDENRLLDATIWGCQQFRDTAGDVPLLWNVLTKPGDDDLDRFLRGDIAWQTSSPLWRREALAKIGPWDELALSGQDWEFHLRALLAGVRYEKVDEIDHHWRIATEDRTSIGKSTVLNKAHADSWAATVGRLQTKFKDAGRNDRTTRLRFASLYFNAARRVGAFVSRREARKIWSRALRRRLVGPVRFLEGWAYLVCRRWPEIRGPIEWRLARRWPAAYFSPDNGTFNRARVPGGPPPLVSVVVPCHNAARYVEDAVHTILRQTLRDIEVIAIDDGSTDNTAAILRRVAKTDVRLTVVSRENRGLIETLNEGFRLARGTFLARMDADDIALPSRLEKQANFLQEHPDATLVGAQVRYLDPHETTLGDSDLPTDHAGIDKLLLSGYGQAVVHPAAMFRRAAYEHVGGYRGDVARSSDGADVCEDLDLFLRLAEVGCVANLPEVLLGYRQHYASITRTKMGQQAEVLPRVVGQAYDRRGLPRPTNGSLEKLGQSYWTPKPIHEQLAEWGWQALKRGKPAAARLHALSLLKRRPLHLDSWRLAYCAVRGR